EARVVVVLPVHEKQITGRRLTVGAVLSAFERSDLEGGYQTGDCLHDGKLAPVSARQVIDIQVRDVGADRADGRLDQWQLAHDGAVDLGSSSSPLTERRRRQRGKDGQRQNANGTTSEHLDLLHRPGNAGATRAQADILAINRVAERPLGVS